MHPSRTLFALALLLPACGDKDDGTTQDSAVDDSEVRDSGDTGETKHSDEPVQNTCEFVGMDRLVFDRAGGDDVGVTLECTDATLVGTPVFEIAELGIRMDLTGEAQPNGTTWKGQGTSLSELEELVAEKGLSFGMDVSNYNLDGDDKVAPPTDNLGAGVRFHDKRTSFGDVTNSPTPGHAFQIGDSIEVVVLEVDKENRSLTMDADGDGGPETYDIRTLTFDVDEGTVGLGSCVVGDDSACTDDRMFDGLPTGVEDSTHPVYGGVTGWQHSTVDVTRAAGKGSVTFGLAVPASDHSSIYVVTADQAGSAKGTEWTLKFSDMSLATSGSGTADPATAPVVLGLGNGGPDAKESSSAVWAAGVGTHEKDGSTVFWGATWKDSTTLASSWTTSTDWTRVYANASVTISTTAGDELVVFGGKDTLEARSFDAASGKELTHVDFEGIDGVQAISSTTADLNGDGDEEMLVAVLDDAGQLHFLSGHFSAEGGLAKLGEHKPKGLVGHWTFDDGHAQDTSGYMNHSMQVGADDAGNVAVVVSRQDHGRHATWASTWLGDGSGSSFLDEAPSHDELIGLDTTGVIFAPGGDTCTPDKETGSTQTGFCGLVVSERLRHKDRSINIWDYERLVLEEYPAIMTSLDWRSDDSRGVPLVDTAGFVVAAVNGQVVVSDRDGNALGDPLDMDAAGSLSAAQVDGTLVLFGSAHGGDMLLVTV